MLVASDLRFIDNVKNERDFDMHLWSIYVHDYESPKGYRANDASDNRRSTTTSLSLIAKLEQHI